MRRVKTGEHSYKWIKGPMDYLESSIPYILWGAISLTIFVCLLLIYYLITAPDSPSFTLSKSDWMCTQEHTSSMPIPQMVGNSMIMNYMTTSTCVNYHKRGF